MQVFGNERQLKEFIKNKYDSKIADLESEYQEKIREAEEQIEQKIQKKKSALNSETQREITQARSKTLSEERLKAKKDFEKTREALINQVLEEVRSNLKQQAHTKQYLNYLKEKTSNINTKNFEVIADGNYYKKLFPKYKENKEISGVKLVSGEITYDFTLESAFNAKQEELRKQVSKTLFS